MKAGGALAAAVMCLTAAVPPLSLGWLHQTREQRRLVESQITLLKEVESLLVDAETGQRGFVITGRPEFLDPYTKAVARLPSELVTLRKRYAGEPDDELALVASIESAAQQKLEELAETVRIRQKDGFSAVEALISGARGKDLMDRVRRSVDYLSLQELDELAALDAELTAKLWRAIAFSIVSTAATFALLGSLTRAVLTSLRMRERAAAQAKQASEALATSMAELQHRNDEISALDDLSKILQVALDMGEALELIGNGCLQLLPGTSGAVYLVRPEAHLLELSAAWGQGARHASQTMVREACWGLRRGQRHRCTASTHLQCNHYGSLPASGFRLCLPLMVYGEVLGQLTLWADDEMSPAVAENITRTAQTVAQHVALALSNVRLRQVLRDQSLRDPLTGLFNRRYMEETLARQIACTQRSGGSVSVVMVDLDHFKKINDLHGHPAGDEVLKAAARTLAAAVRAGDVACRYGGEEFMLILSDCAKDAAVAKARDICRQLAAMLVNIGPSTPLQVTASLGVAAFPDDGRAGVDVVQHADAALYRAKQAGRNQVVAATQPVDEAAMPALA